MQLARPHGRSEAEEDDATLRYDAERSSAARNLLGCKNQNSFQVEVMHNSLVIYAIITSQVST